MKKSSQDRVVDTTAVFPEQVSVAMAEIAGNMSEGLLALAVGAGPRVLQTLMEADVTARAGPKGRHNPDRAAVRHGHEKGSVTLGGRRVPVTRPRVRASGGSGELPVASYELFSSAEIPGRMVMEKMLAGSTWRYPLGLEPAGPGKSMKHFLRPVGAFRRVLPRDRVGDRHRRAQASAGAGGVEGSTENASLGPP